jgi:hypothetical protein
LFLKEAKNLIQHFQEPKSINPLCVPKINYSNNVLALVGKYLKSNSLQEQLINFKLFFFPHLHSSISIPEFLSLFSALVLSNSKFIQVKAALAFTMLK